MIECWQIVPLKYLRLNLGLHLLRCIFSNVVDFNYQKAFETQWQRLFINCSLRLFQSEGDDEKKNHDFYIYSSFKKNLLSKIFDSLLPYTKYSKVAISQHLILCHNKILRIPLKNIYITAFVSET